jgi:RNA polymerase sigma factor (sigma-70 family)
MLPSPSSTPEQAVPDPTGMGLGIVDAATDTAPVDAARARRERLATLLRAAQQGERGALDAIVAELTPLLWHVARARGLAVATAEDVVQTTWLCLLTELRTIHTPEALAGWLVTVARREATRVLAGSRRELPTDELSDEPVAVDTAAVAEERLLGDDRRRALWRAVDALPQRCRELLRVVAFVDRPDYAAVAEALRMPRGSIGPTRGRCLARLRESLAGAPEWSWE